MAGLVRIEFTINVCDGHLDVVASVIIWCLRHRCHGVWVALLCRSRALLLLIHVSHLGLGGEMVETADAS